MSLNRANLHDRAPQCSHLLSTGVTTPMQVYVVQ